MAGLLMMEPIFAQRVWGGSALRTWFGDEVPDGSIGECWAVSGLPEMSGRIRAGAPAGWTLAQAWSQGLVTGSPRTDDFPLLCKFLDPRDWLSVQVHPNDEQAARLEGQPRGKAECWLVIECTEGAELILGHRASTIEQLRDHLRAGTLLDQLVKVTAKPGDFYMVPAGVVHSLGPGLLVYEVQQSSDITYRLYDFDRVGLDGRPRELSVERGFSVVTAPHDPAACMTAGAVEFVTGGWRRTLVDNPQFKVTYWDIQGAADISGHDYRIISVISGGGWISTPTEHYDVGLGTSLVIPAGTGPVELGGNLMAVTTDPGPAL